MAWLQQQKLHRITEQLGPSSKNYTELRNGLALAAKNYTDRITEWLGFSSENYTELQNGLALATKLTLQNGLALAAKIRMAGTIFPYYHQVSAVLQVDGWVSLT